MKTQIEVYGQSYEIEIKARDTRNLNASKKATEKVIQWFKARLIERKNEEDPQTIMYDEITKVLKGLYKIK